jgi:hypothetical protein
VRAPFEGEKVSSPSPSPSRQLLHFYRSAGAFLRAGISLILFTASEARKRCDPGLLDKTAVCVFCHTETICAFPGRILPFLIPFTLLDYKSPSVRRLLEMAQACFFPAFV